MGRLLKILLSIFAVVIVLIIIAVVAIPLFVDPNDFKPEIQAAVKDKLGRDLMIEGDLDLSIFPWIGISTGKITLSNAPGFSDKPFAEIIESDVKVKLMPLFSKKVEVRRIILKGLNLNLAKNKQGVNNWDDLSQPDSKPQPETEDEPTKEGVNPLAALAVGGIAIEQAHIVWDDQQQEQYVEISDFNFNTDELAFNQPIAIELSANIANKEPEINESINISIQLTVNENLEIFDIKDINLKSITTGKDIPGGKLTANLQSDIAVDLTQQNVKISGLKLNLDDVTEEKLAISLISDIAVNLSNQTINTSGLNLTADRLMQNKLTANLLADFAVNLEQQTLSISGMKLSAGELLLTGDIKGNQIKENPSFKGAIDIAAFNLAQFMKKLEIELPEMQDAQAMNQLAVAFNLQATTDSADIQNLKIKLDDSNINGSVSVKNFTKPAVKFNIKVDALDANRYLAPEQEKPAQKVVTPATAAVAGASLFPVETLRNLDANGTLAIGQLKINQLNMKGINLKLNARKGIIKTQQAIKQLYQGSYSGKSSINVQQKTPKLTLNEKLSNIQVEPLLKAMDITDRMSGMVNAFAQIQGRGNTTEAIKSSLNGNLDFSFKDSIIKGFNLQKIIDNSRALIEGKALPAENKNDQTVFSVIKGSATIKNGLLRNDDLIAQSSKVHVKGKGTANLATEALSYKVDARVLKRAATATEAEKIRGVPLAVDIAGTFAEPTYQLDIQAMLKAKYQAKIDKKINKEKDKLLKKLDEKLGPGVGDILKGLF